MQVLFAVGSWGLGHATRDLTIIQRMLAAGWSVTLISTDRAMTLLRDELDGRCEFLDLPDIPKPLARSSMRFYGKYALNLPLAFRAVVAERRALHDLLRVRTFDRIVSDCRYGIASAQVPSFQITHGLRIMPPLRCRPIERFIEYVNYRWLRQAKRVLVPDFAENSLSGELSHGLHYFRDVPVDYLGHLSGIRRRDLPQDIDYFISISGPEPQRSILDRIIRRQAHTLPGRVVIALGLPGQQQVERYQNVEIHAYLNRSQQEEMMNRSRLIISRSGYTTLMELAELGKKALLIPTPGQTEQEYLARYHARLGTFSVVTQDRLDLPRDVARAERCRGYRPPHGSDVTVENFLRVIAEG